MPRPTVWQRAHREGALGAKANLHLYDVAVLNPGETVGRIRFSFQGSRTPEFDLPGEPYGLVVGVGVIVQPSTVSSGFVPRPLSDPEADWMWWEVCHWESQFALQNASGNYQAVETYPADTGERDVRAQRGPMTEESTVWVVAEASGVGGPQTFHFFSVGVSLLNLQPL